LLIFRQFAFQISFSSSLLNRAVSKIVMHLLMITVCLEHNLRLL